jgi:hypothetical protein
MTEDTHDKLRQCLEESNPMEKEALLPFVIGPAAKLGIASALSLAGLYAMGREKNKTLEHTNPSLDEFEVGGVKIPTLPAVAKGVRRTGDAMWDTVKSTFTGKDPEGFNPNDPAYEPGDLKIDPFTGKRYRGIKAWLRDLQRPTQEDVAGKASTIVQPLKMGKGQQTVYDRVMADPDNLAVLKQGVPINLAQALAFSKKYPDEPPMKLYLKKPRVSPRTSMTAQEAYLSGTINKDTAPMIERELKKRKLEDGLKSADRAKANAYLDPPEVRRLRAIQARAQGKPTAGELHARVGFDSKGKQRVLPQAVYNLLYKTDVHRPRPVYPEEEVINA